MLVEIHNFCNSSDIFLLILHEACLTAELKRKKLEKIEKLIHCDRERERERERERKQFESQN